MNDLVKNGKIKAPIVIGARPSGLRIGGVSLSRNRKHEGRSDAVADWPLLKCAAQHSQRRELGVDPQWRRRKGLAIHCTPGRLLSPMARR